MKKTILKVEDLHIGFTQYISGFHQQVLTPINGLSIELYQGEVHALIGASGSGKSLLAHGILGILPYNAQVTGNMEYCGKPLTQQEKEKLRGREIAFIPQSVNYLDPLMKVGKQIRIGLPKEQALRMEMELLKKYDLDVAIKDKYPFQLSGGMLRRILFATSVREGIRLVIADEPTPGIHPEALSAVLNQLRGFADNGAAVLLITHDIISALTISDRVTVLRNGKSVESIEADAFSGRGEQLTNPYSKALWHALPGNDFMHSEEVDLWL